jgi:class 3 adenylate cyclase
MYIDRHDLPEMTPEALAAAHVLDVDVQSKHGVEFHTYWFDPDAGSVFCLAQGPNSEAVQAVHAEAHGAVAHSIIEIGMDAPLNELFGGLPIHPVGTAYTAPAMRAIAFTDIRGSVAQTYELGDEGHMALLREHDEIVRRAVLAHEGREVKHTGDGIMVAFTSVSAAVAFAIAVQRAVAARNASAAVVLNLGIGISAGEPVTNGSDDLFGAAVQLAARLCAAAEPGEIAVSVAVKELSIGKGFHFADRGSIALKGLPEPAHVYTVSWVE